jgi:hypothetical protein
MTPHDTFQHGGCSARICYALFYINCSKEKHIWGGGGQFVSIRPSIHIFIQKPVK